MAVINGTAASETLSVGTAGNDSVSGAAGDDLAFLGAGNDLFQWEPGDGNDTVEGEAGTDTLLFHRQRRRWRSSRSPPMARGRG